MNLETMTIEQIREYVEYRLAIISDRNMMNKWNLNPIQELAVQHSIDRDNVAITEFVNKHHPY